MDSFALEIGKTCDKVDKVDPTDPRKQQGSIYVQLVLSLALGLSAFIGFSFLRPRWKSLYAARKRQTDAATALPDLPDTFFGWMPVLYKITEQQVLASAGLDAYVFLAFFKMSIKLFGVMFFITGAILTPINAHFYKGLPNFNTTISQSAFSGSHAGSARVYYYGDMMTMGGHDSDEKPDTSFMWAYLVFTYLFTGIAIYFLTTETRHIIQVRQNYLGSQSTITDRTIKLSGIPKELRSEEAIKDFLEKLQIGKVESVTICRNWKRIDDMMEKRAYTLRRLEEAWTVHLGRENTKTTAIHHILDERQQDIEEAPGDEEQNLLGNNHVTTYDQPRPTTRLWYGVLNLQSKKVDAIDYFEEELRKLDEQIAAARKKFYKPTPLAFVTMDSIPACQMAVQALLDPSPGQLLANLAPAPSDIVWRNTYLPRSSRMIRSWTITIFILILTIIWLIPVAALAGLIDLCSIQQVWPQAAKFLAHHPILKSLVQTGLPTLVMSLLNIAVPFLYDYLANMQGTISQGDVELSVISKNFFFTFFNVFIVFTVFGTASRVWSTIADSIKDTTLLAFNLASSVQGLADFYTNFILLQGVGLLPFRLLEFGSVSLYPIMLWGSRTPRDYAELVQPPVFKYGFYLPSAILVWVLCLVYSILPAGYKVLLFGLIYFVFGYYTYKYQLLYAMDHPQHSTGGAWPMTCYRLLIGIAVFQLVMGSIISLQSAIIEAILVVPLLPFTIWYSYYFARTYEPLMKHIALRSIRREDDPDVNIAGEDVGIDSPPGHTRRASTTVDEQREAGMHFVNPNLTIPLEKAWIHKNPNTSGNGNGNGNTDAIDPGLNREESAASSLSLGDTHIWRENGDANV